MYVRACVYVCVCANACVCVFVNACVCYFVSREMVRVPF
jgi:hypothetical protein